MDFCNANSIKLFELIGIFLLILKLAIPLVIIALGIFDYYKAIVGNKDDEIKKSTKTLIRRLIAGIIIFFLPSFVKFVFNIVNVGSNQCISCTLNLKDCNYNGSNQANGKDNNENQINEPCTIENKNCLSNILVS